MDSNQAASISLPLLAALGLRNQDGRGVLIAVLLLSAVFIGGMEVNAQPEVRERIEAAEAPHPRLFVEGTESSSASAPPLKNLQEVILREADEVLAKAPIERTMEGQRMLTSTRQALHRILYLAYAYRHTGDVRYADRAENEMRAAAGFSDWNPNHFLDTAEMTAALAIGYDWLYHELSPSSRKAIRRAIVEKGLKPSFAEDWWWIEEFNNWNQVCHGGLVLGALAVMDRAPDLAVKVIERAVEEVRRPMTHYAPNGGYFEGPSYWFYGTHYNVLMIDALESALDTNFGLTDIEPFMRSPTYYLHSHAPTSRYFNYSDSNLDAPIAPAMYWFADRLDRPDLLWMEKRKLDRLSTETGTPDGRLIPMLLVWGNAAQVRAAGPPSQTHFTDSDPLAVGIHRTRWDEEALFVGMEGGRATRDHAHLDAGSFVIEAEGIRWAVDLGAQDYHSLEKAGVRLWNFAQDGDRWKIFRLNNFSHNTLVVNNALQRADAFAPVVSHTDGPRPHTVLDLSDVYAGELAEATRGVAVVDSQSVLVQDEIAAPVHKPASVRWAMTTRAHVQLVDAQTATLTQGGETLQFRVLSPEGVEVELYSTTPPAPYDARNPGTQMIGFTTTLPSGTEARLAVAVTPEPPDAPAPELLPLDEW